MALEVLGALKDGFQITENLNFLTKKKGDLIMKGRVKKGKTRLEMDRRDASDASKMGCRHGSSGEVKGSIILIVQI